MVGGVCGKDLVDFEVCVYVVSGDWSGGSVCGFIECYGV